MIAVALRWLVSRQWIAVLSALIVVPAGAAPNDTFVSQRLVPQRYSDLVSPAIIKIGSATGIPGKFLHKVQIIGVDDRQPEEDFSKPENSVAQKILGLSVGPERSCVI